MRNLEASPYLERADLVEIKTYNAEQPTGPAKFNLNVSTERPKAEEADKSTGKLPVMAGVLMKRRAWVIGLLPLLVSTSACLAQQPTPAPAPAPANLASGNNAFAWELYREISGRDGNLFFSPFSVELALAMTMAGARGETAQQMQQTLRLAGGTGIARGGGSWQSSVLPAADDSLTTFTVANRLWGQTGLVFAPDFPERDARALRRRDRGGRLSP